MSFLRQAQDDKPIPIDIKITFIESDKILVQTKKQLRNEVALVLYKSF